jgi:hypothetical protein
MDEKLHQHDIMIVVIGEFHISWKGVMLYFQMVWCHKICVTIFKGLARGIVVH